MRFSPEPFPSVGARSREIVAIWRVPMDLDRPLRDDEWAILSADERARGERFKFDAPRLRLVRCRRALRIILGDWLQVPPVSLKFDYGPHGKPVLLAHDHAPSFNVSHSHDWAMIAVTEHGDIGIDVERCDPRTNWRGLAQRFFALSEVDSLFALDSEQHLRGFYQIWTGKEAFIKAIGRGLSFPLGHFRVEARPDRPRALLGVDDPAYDAAAWQLSAVDPAPDYIATVIWNGPARSVACFDFVSR